MYSYLALAHGDTNEDGLLEAWEIMQLDLKADLAVLSACETARGRFGAGEGMIGLSWAMFIAGVPTTVVSQWKVESASTRDLMIEFHRQSLTAKSKPTKAEALRQAALKLMKNPATSHPFYWAGFVLVGDGR
jgi:CHAT domain-containing protein